MTDFGLALVLILAWAYLIASTGRFDYLAEITCRNNKHLLDFMHRRLPTVPGVQDSESFGYLSVLKESYRGSA